VDGDGLAEVDHAEFPLLDDEVVLREVAVDLAGADSRRAYSRTTS